jgi:flagellar assembly protein FliH
MAYAKLIAFDRPLLGATLPGQAGRTFNEGELAARDETAYRRGVDAARAQADQQIVELRADMQQLGDGVLQKLGNLEPLLVAQLRDALPGLALEIARRLLAGYEPPAEVVARLCEEALSELFPERENLELAVSVRDQALLEELNPSWLARYPGLRIRSEPALAPAIARCGAVSASRTRACETKLGALAHNLVPA